jgi:hypothetical protein
MTRKSLNKRFSPAYRAGKLLVALAAGRTLSRAELAAYLRSETDIGSIPRQVLNAAAAIVDPGKRSRARPKKRALLRARATRQGRTAAVR